MKKRINVLWAVPCSYYGSEALSDLYEFFEGEKFKEMEEINFVGAYDGGEASKKIYDNAGDLDLVVLDYDLPYAEIAERFLLGIARKNFFIIRIIKSGEFQLEKIERENFFQLKGDLEGPFQDIKKILEKIF
jgi:hypothetical protein